jgi:uncharacterized membrane protein
MTTAIPMLAVSQSIATSLKAAVFPNLRVELLAWRSDFTAFQRRPKAHHMSQSEREPAPNPVRPQTPVVSNYGLVLTVYILYLVGFLTGIILVGVTISYLQRDNTDRISQSHFQFQITTFWIGLLYFFVGLLTLHIGIGALILLWYVVWTVIRCVKGLLALNMGEPIRNPNSWWFGET